MIPISPAMIKYAGAVIGIVAFSIGMFTFGMKMKQQQWDASLMKQAIKTAETTIKTAENTAKVEVRYIKVKGAVEIRTNEVIKEVTKYVEVQSPICHLSPAWVTAYDSITIDSLLGGDSVRMPLADASADDADGSPAPVVTEFEVIQSRIDAVTQLTALWLRYDALREWVKSNYELQLIGSGHGGD